MLFQPSNISPSEINNSGTVDLTQPLTISWQVNGDSAMTAYQIVFYQNDAGSTQLYDTGQVSLAQPFWGINYAGQVQYYTVTIPAATLSANGLTNGGEYKFIITQWWSENDSIQQSTASLFLGRAAPSVSIDTIDSPLTGYAYSFTGTYTQEQGDALRWVQWQICEVDENGNEKSPFYDTGRIYGTGELRTDYDGFLNDSSYAVQLSIETANGVSASTGWVQFSVEYEVGETEGSVAACVTRNGDVFVEWEQIVTSKGYDIYRLTEGEAVLDKIISVDDTVGSIRDWAVQAGKSYTYYVFPTGPLAYLNAPAVSNTVTVKFWLWNIVEASLNSNGIYTALASYIFRYGSAGGVKEGQFSNNNTPTLQKNFTPYPTRQPETANYLTGSLSGLIGTVSREKIYSDTTAQARALRNLSVSTNTLFLRDPEGHFINIHTSQPITMNVNHKNAVMPKTVGITWVEVGGADGVKIISTPEDSFWPADNILFTTITVDPLTGMLIWTVPDDYNEGSMLTLVNGELVQTAQESYTAADLDITDGNVLTATLSGAGIGD